MNPHIMALWHYGISAECYHNRNVCTPCITQIDLLRNLPNTDSSGQEQQRVHTMHHAG